MNYDFKPSPLIYDKTKIDNVTHIKNILLISQSINDYNVLVSACNEDTFPIIFSTISTKAELLEILQTKFTTLERLGIAFLGNHTIFLDSKPFFVENECNENTQFVVDVITRLQLKNIDYLGCNTLQKEGWVSYYKYITSNTTILLGASNDATGNIRNHNSDWIMESTNQDIEFIYFNESIKYYNYVLDSVPDIRPFTLNYTKSWNGSYNVYLPQDGTYLGKDITIYITAEIDINGFVPYYSYIDGSPIKSAVLTIIKDGHITNYTITGFDLVFLYFTQPINYEQILLTQLYDFNFYDTDSFFGGAGPGVLRIPSLSLNAVLTSINPPVLRPAPTTPTIITVLPPVTCFKENTRILTQNGYVYVQDLKIKDLVKTALHGFIPIICIGKQEIMHYALKERIKDQLYQYAEYDNLCITGCHSVLVHNISNYESQIRNVLGNIYVTDNMYRLPACIDPRADILPESGKYIIYHIALDNNCRFGNYGIYANGLLVETCSIRYLTELSNMTIIQA
jgi:hypothetical protein